MNTCNKANMPISLNSRNKICHKSHSDLLKFESRLCTQHTMTRVRAKKPSNHGSIPRRDKRFISSPKPPHCLGGYVTPPTQCSKKEMRCIK
jgi:hypothetical protein